jgi:hypothetical protein
LLLARKLGHNGVLDNHHSWAAEVCDYRLSLRLRVLAVDIDATGISLRQDQG